MEVNKTLTKDMWFTDINILGSVWSVYVDNENIRTTDEDDYVFGASLSGSRTIVIYTATHKENLCKVVLEDKNLNVWENAIVSTGRHELIHAYMDEAGCVGFRTMEELVCFFEMNIPKIEQHVETFKAIAERFHP